MGQWWYIINIYIREHLGCWGKLGKFFSTPDDYGDIISLLEESWVGCRIMCIGDNAEDSPSGILTPEELDEIKTLPGSEAEKTFLTLAVNTYKEIHAGDGYDLHGIVLRNLMKKFYVCRDVVVKELASYRGDLCNVLLANICYTADSCVMRPGISSGAWAGDRFDVARLSDVENDEEWEDVTKDQVKLTRFALSCS